MKYLRIYQSLGVDVELKEGSIQATGVCPFCGRPKFSINVRNGTGHCWACPRLNVIQGKEGFNLISFIRLLWKDAYKDGRGLSLVSNEKNIPISELIKWGFRYTKTGKIVLPGYDIAGRIIQIYRWEPIKGKNRTIATETLPSALVYLPKEIRYNPIYLCEGIWDAIVLRSHIKYGTCIAVPGAMIFNEEWKKLFDKKDVYICYDNDIAGKDGSRKVAKILYGVANRVLILNWSDKLPEGYDIRDYISEGFDNDKFHRLFRKATPTIERQPITFDKLIEYWKDAIFWTDNLTRVLAILLATCVNTFIKGDQIWLRLIGSPSSGKTTLCEALGMLKEYVTVVSTMTGFYSGWLGKDQSLVNKLRGKILITKDADTLIQSPNLKQILSEARDIYDGYGRAIYRNSVDREYKEVTITWILAGTSLVATFGDRELGERFLNVTTYRILPEEVEAKLAYKKIEQTIKQITEENGEKPEAINKAMVLTAGYLKDLIESVNTRKPSFKLSDEDQIRIYHLASFVARLRARPSKLQSEFVERELVTRLCSQFTKLLYCLTIVFKTESPNEECWKCLEKVAIDTSDGISLQVVKFLFDNGESSTTDIMREIPACKRTLLDYLACIDVLKKDRKKTIMWNLTDSFRELYEIVKDYSDLL